MKNIMNIIKNIFKQGKKIRTISPKLIEAEFQGKKQPVFLYTQYGTLINPPNDLIVGLLADQGNEESLMAFITDTENREEMEEGEIGFGIPSLKARIYFRNNGKITFKVDDTEGGDFAVRFLELKAGFDELKDNFNNLESALSSIISGAPILEPGNGSPSALQAALAGSFTVSAPLPSTASIDDSKVEEIELPEL